MKGYRYIFVASKKEMKKNNGWGSNQTSSSKKNIHRSNKSKRLYRTAEKQGNQEGIQIHPPTMPHCETDGLYKDFSCHLVKIKHDLTKTEEVKIAIFKPPHGWGS